MRLSLKILSILLFSVLLSGCAGEVTLNQQDVLFEIKKGDNIHTITKKLKSEHIIKNPLRFQVLTKLMRKDNELKFGVYQISKGEKYVDLIDKFSSGKTYSIRVTIPEGYTIFQIAETLEEKNLVKKDEFLAECKSADMLSMAGLPAGSTLEGYLYPDTYQFPKEYSTKKIIAAFVENFHKNVDEKVMEQIKKRGKKLKDILIIASIVEREAKQDFEKPIMAGVYYKRLKIGMKLQADPTLIYALELAGKYDGDIKYGDFSIDSRYNTYRYYGMPPGPISNPSRTSVLAAIYPADVDYLYFVAKPDGSHYFSKTLEEHNRAVYQYQKLPAIERRMKERDQKK